MTASAVWLMLVIAAGSLTGGLAGGGCAARDYGHGSVVCVCNSVYCDAPELLPQEQLDGGNVAHYVSTKDGKRLHLSTALFSSSLGLNVTPVTEGSASFHVNYSTRFQEILGFGGAATDSATINTYSLSSATADSLIRSYFGEEGIGYSFIRVPLGGSDFSTHNYEYTDEYPGDISLKHFNLSLEDFEYKIPFIKRAIQVSPVPIKLLTAAWSAPRWMKEVVDPATNATSLKKEYLDVYASYYVKFLKAYAAQGLTYWGLSPQNNPTGGLLSSRWNMMGWQPDYMMQYLAYDLCPALRDASFSTLQVLVPDDSSSHLPRWLQVFKDAALQDCVSGLGLQWYTDEQTSHDILDQVHQEYPDKFILYTEACIEEAVALGSWERGARYISSIIQVASHWGTGWLDWNLALDEGGGPNWAGNFVDAPVIVNASGDEFYKQPMFYALAHVSRFVPPGSVRVGLDVHHGELLEAAAFLTPHHTTVLVLHSSAENDVEVVITDPGRGSIFLGIPANSIHTIVYKQKLEVHSEL